MQDPDPLLVAFRQQMRWCERLDAPFTAQVVAWLSHDRAAGGPVRTLLPQWPGDPVADLVPLRLAGALHALVLSGREPALAALYPPYASRLNFERTTPVLRDVLLRNDVHMRAYLASAPQTNEPLRSAVLLGGFARIAARFRLPLALREIGASAGLNLLWDRFGYSLGGDLFHGPPSSPVQLTSDWRGDLPELPETIDVHDRRGCDLAPLSLLDPAGAQRLAAYVWPEQQRRLHRLQAAIGLARHAGLAVTSADAAAWTQAQLAEPTPGCTTVLYHSIVWQYLPLPTRERLQAVLQQAGERASVEAPLAWLAFEVPAPEVSPELHLTCWPGGTRELLARAHPHGEWVEWLAPASAP